MINKPATSIYLESDDSVVLRGLQTILETDENTRAFMWDLLVKAGTFAGDEISADTNTNYYEQGRRSVGRRLFKAMQRPHLLPGFRKMQDEAEHRGQQMIVLEKSGILGEAVRRMRAAMNNSDE